MNTDLAPTIADVSPPSFVDGSYFAPLLTTTPPASWRTAFLQEGWPAGGTVVPAHKSIHTQKYMFTEYDTGERELCDLNSDPYQPESQPRRTGNEQLYSTLQARLDALRSCSGEGCRSAEWATDTTPPRVTNTVPAHNATGVAPSTNLIANFSLKMDPTSVTKSTFKRFKINPD